MSATTARADKAERTRARIVEAAERLLNEAADHDISTRAVCEAAGVAQPILYRLFGDKEGLLAAVVDAGFGRYIARKQALERTDDPVSDLRAGWDDHMEFAFANPAVYRLMFSPALRTAPEAAGRIFELLVRQLDRCAAVGATTIPSNDAAQAILSANVGVTLSILSQPERYRDPGLSTRVRDAVFASCLTPGAHSGSSPESTLAVAALQLDAQLRVEEPSQLGDEERALMLKWLRTLQAATSAAHD